MPIQKSLIEDARPDMAGYETLYKYIHKHPELSHQEAETASLIVQQLEALSADLEIRTGIGGHGLVAILRNGPGSTVLLRADFDALPVAEKTNLEYASVRTQIDSSGKETPVMHACGHDVHVVCLLIAAETLLKMRKSWSGTIVFLFQPAEEAGDGARGMVEDGLFDSARHNCPIPDIVLGQHVAPIPAGMVTSKSGAIMSSSDSMKVTIYGRGGHGSMPHRCIDPIVIASHIVVRLQTIVSRVVPPDEVAVITVGAIHAGEAENVICDHAFFTINVRTLSDEVRSTVLEHIRKVVESECNAGFCEKSPLIEHHMSVPVTDNAHATENKLQQTFRDHFGPEFFVAPKSSLASEDFSILASSIGKPYCFWLFGGTDRELWDSLLSKGQLDKVPINHSAHFAPAIHPTLRTGGDAMTAAALTFLAIS
ncbi:N(alpha)-acyl-glutamine aminoacylase [Exophiala dermatitidis]